MGILSWVINGAVIWLAGQFINGFEVADLGTAMLTALGLTIINLIASSLLTIDDDGFFYRNIVRQRMKRRDTFTETEVFPACSSLRSMVFQDQSWNWRFERGMCQL